MIFSCPRVFPMADGQVFAGCGPLLATLLLGVLSVTTDVTLMLLATCPPVRGNRTSRMGFQEDAVSSEHGT